MCSLPEMRRKWRCADPRQSCLHNQLAIFREVAHTKTFSSNLALRHGPSDITSQPLRVSYFRSIGVFCYGGRTSSESQPGARYAYVRGCCTDLDNEFSSVDYGVCSASSSARCCYRVVRCKIARKVNYSAI